MKKLYALFFLLASVSSFSQVIDFPDIGFKAVAVAYADLDLDGEVTQEEAGYCSMMTISGTSVTSLEGLQYFFNLQDLGISNTSLTTISLTNANETYLSISNNPLLTAIVVSGTALYYDGESYFTGNPSLQSLDISGYENSVFVNVTENPSLASLALNHSTRFLDAHNNGLTSIDFSDAVLTVCDISYNQLASIDLPNMLDDGMLYQFSLNLSGNLYTSIEFPEMIFPFWDNGMSGILTIENTHLQQLNLRRMQLSNLYIQNNPDLTFINFRNGSEDAAVYNGEGYLYSWVEHITYANNPSVAYVCVDEIENWGNLAGTTITDGITRMSDIINDPNVVISYYCTSVPGGTFNIVNGTVRFDADGNGCSESDAPVSGLNIAANNYFTTTNTDSEGHFSAYSTNGYVTVSVPPIPYFTVSPASYSYNFNTDSVAEPEFCITPNGTHTDMSVSVIPMQATRPGFPVSYKVICKNLGTTSQPGYVTLNFNNDRTFNSSVTTLDQNNTGSISWNTPVLAPFATFENTVIFTMNGPTDTPAVNLGQETHITAGLAVASDENTANNTTSVFQTTIGSYDPNDKAVNQGAEVSLEQATDGFDYTVRFQNTGTASADRVVIEDMIDEGLDLSTLRIIGSSHPYTLQVMGRKLVAFFENINLPASEDDEPGSHGYITYHIKPTNTVAVGSQFSNTASIFFDFNFPIVTNEVVTEVIELGTVDTIQDDAVKMFPNPAKNQLTVMANGMVAVTIYSITGQKLIETGKRNEHLIDVSMLSEGTYLTEIVSDEGKTVRKLIKY
ncbi:DUF7619 domain-containing protein [Flavobacterium silvaticum]|uniref:T9SS type A sorting domain-containing protein n=1 Tax=Flavobacterium silvaticum TaxID=1852020 RepID=A0A972JK42_9FLAO|nr:T9SS type A sorting domain-containing protein [Flavobacterium silvaticum]NMH28752.1 T9SS type A sorting domain-containing protein [Flavobacterium silvaticum]